MVTTPTNIQLYASAVFPDGYRCLGRSLQPITIGHLLLLIRLKSPFVVGEKIPDAVDLGLAVAVCSLPFRRAVDAVEKRWFRRRVTWLGFLATHRRRELRAFAAYLKATTAGPQYWIEGKERTRAPQTPYWVAVQMTLMRDLGLSCEESLGTPVAAALWLCAAIWEGNGGIRIESDVERQLKAETVARESAVVEAPNA